MDLNLIRRFREGRGRSARVGALLAQGDRANAARDWPLAADCYRRVLAAEPGRGPIWVQLGHAEKEQGRLHEAEAHYRRAIALMPEDADARLQLGHALKLQQRVEEALEAYRAAQERDPERADARAEIAWCVEQLAMDRRGTEDEAWEAGTGDAPAPAATSMAEAPEAEASSAPDEAAARARRLGALRDARAAAAAAFRFRPKETLLAERELEEATAWVCQHRELREIALYVSRAVIESGAARIEADGRPAALRLDPVVEAPEGTSVCRLTARCLVGSGETRRVVVSLWERTLFEGDLPTLPAFEGRIEKIADGVVQGWAIDFLAGDAPTRVEILVNNIVATTVTAGLPRPDVGALYPGRDESGFRAAIGEIDFGAETLRVSARIAGADAPLPSRARRPIPGRAPAPAPEEGTLPETRPVSIVVPIYNAPAETAACVASILRHTRVDGERVKLILLDDRSPDPEVARVLAPYEGRPGVTVVRHPENLGYTGNVNAGIRLSGTDDVVLLNSDTEVTPRWLWRLARAAWRRPTVGTVTALSDNAGAFSVPQRNARNAIPPWLTPEAAARLVAQTSARAHPAVLTGSGFCLYIKRALIDEIGLFDEERFPRGYGEENDFCLRALHAGWTNVVADDALVFHERSASFGEQKTELMARASDLVPELYPEYTLGVHQTFVQSPRMTAVRYRIAAALRHGEGAPAPRILYVIGVESGGTPQTNADLMGAVAGEFDPYLLVSNTQRLRLYRHAKRERRLVEEIPLHDPVGPITHDSNGYARAVAALLQRLEPELIHVRHIGRHGLSLLRVAERMGIPVVFSFHDFYAVCPNTKLFDAAGAYCAGDCANSLAARTGTENDCNIELWNPAQAPALRGEWIRSWRAMFAHALRRCDHFVTTSPAARDLIIGLYGLDPERFSVIPHARDFARFSASPPPPAGDEPLRLLSPGHLVPSKGLELIRAVKALDLDGRLEFHFLGGVHGNLDGLGVVHGPYDREAFQERATATGAHLGVVFSLWPETYSHTLTELWSAGLPVATTAFGALGERIAAHGGGWAFEDLSPQAVYERLIALRDDPDEIDARALEVRRWQRGYGRGYDVAAMARLYVRLYRETLARRVGTEARTASVWTTALAPARDRAGFGDGRAAEPALKAAAAEGASLDLGAAPLAALEHLGGQPRPDRLVALWSDEAAPRAEALARWSRSAAESGAATPLDLVLCPMGTGDAPTPALEALAGRAERVHASDATIEEFAAAGRTLPNLVSFSPVADRRLDAEIMEGSSRLAAPHNRRFIDAHFSTLDWDALLAGCRRRQAGLTSIVVPTYNRVALTEQLLRSIAETVEEPCEIVLVDNGCDEAASRALARLPGIDGRARVLRAPRNMMFSFGCNYGAAASTGEHILFLNNDMKALGRGWLEALVEPLRSDPTVGATGGKLLFEDGTVQHAGIVFGPKGAIPYHIHSGLSRTDARVSAARRYRALTGACLAVRAPDFFKLRGFSPVFVNGMEDVDFCLRMGSRLSRDLLYVPDAELFHYEGRTPGRGRHNGDNRRAFVALHGGSIRADDVGYYAADKVEVVAHRSEESHYPPDLRQYRPVFAAANRAERPGGLVKVTA